MQKQSALPRAVYCLVFLIGVLAATAQKATPAPGHAHLFWVTTYGEALQKANAANGVVLVRLAPVGCTMCTPTAEKVFRRIKFLDSLTQFCSAGIYLSAADSSAERLQIQSGDNGNTAFVFVDQEGRILYRYEGNVPGESDYLNGMQRALDRKQGIDQLHLLEAERVLDEHNEGLLEQIIAERSAEGLSTDSLLDVYVSDLPVDSATSTRILHFLASQSPVLNSLANQLLRQDPATFGLVWNGLSMAERYQINNRVIAKTWQKAVADKDLDEARLAATFAANTNGSGAARVRAFDGIMLEFYYGTSDTARFLSLATTYYDRFLVHLNTDSLKEQDSLNRRTGDLSVARFVGAQLEKAAFRIYTISADTGLLHQAAGWADKAYALHPTSRGLEIKILIRARLDGKEQ